MLKLLKFEFYNMVRQKIIYIVMVIMLIFLTLLNQTSPARLEYYNQIGYGVEDMIVGALTSCFFTSFIAIIVSFIACRDYEQRVIKNIYAKGYTHSIVYGTKYLFVMLVTVACYVLTVGVAYVEAMVVFGPQKTNIFMIMFAQLVAALAYSAFGFMICQLMRKSGFAIAFLILVPPIGGLLLDMLDGALPISFCFGDLWITQTMSYIHGGTISGKEIGLSLVTSIAYMIGCYFIGLQCGKKQ